ncbi:hypothetical protein L6R49_30365 [Myxococcota bacterium]|nr:hypothetical protein [Myxococcota bacterium]
MFGLLTLLACAPTAAVVAEDAAGPTLVGVTWALDWRLGAVQVHEGGLTLTRDDGVLSVSEGSLGDVGLSLIPCETSDSGLARLNPIRAAYAGHGATLDSSTWSEGLVEQLTTPETRVLGAAAFEPTRYCGAHYAVAPAGAGWEGASEEATGKTFRLVGGLDGAAHTPLAETSYAHGALIDLLPAAEGLHPGQAHDLRITVTRDLEAALQAMPLGGDPHDAAWLALGQMMDTVSVSLTPTDE